MSRHGNHVTLGEVAQAAGVSIATASRAINGSAGRRVNEEIKKRVQETADRLGYSPNLSAQAVARGASSTIAVVVSDIADPYFSAIAAGVMRGAEEANLIVTIAAAERSVTNELEIVRTLRGQRPRAIILTGSRRIDDPQQAALEEQLLAYDASGGRVVLVAQAPSPFDVVELRNRDGAQELARQLVNQGGRRFGIITGPLELLTNRDRVDGFTEGLAESDLGIDDDAVISTSFTRDGGYEALRTLLSRFPDTDTIFATSDLMATGVLTALRDLGKEPGRDVSVAGFDDIALVRDVTPPLTTVVAPLSDMGYRAVRLALAERGTDGPVVLPVNTAVVIRESTPRRG
ncbi:MULTISPECIES: LacI family DNA-binding transcriptional regulator [unclassified Pseudoclavibacter]|uniref:LacI family DNA-binding transcriptional regulator n=1 Tax=unclassified Pseudoclavibacter TaxID=2615177 RepID=UPI000CE8898A|nr:MULTISPECIES: LacI family DNA-binding transcriptional regulator [unclassified Pseudoclavibacter]MBF4552027.1 LacI family DNA-binding transcriptional regulator [Pseudoclavibacter sp. VKM Ac-2888]PPF37649.1 LacI family transcriptional regulator [Pseudoclavibacter sp. AY1H1]